MNSEGIDNQNLKEKTAQGLFWAFLSSGGIQLLNLIIGIFLARLLSPGEYGIVGMLAISHSLPIIYRRVDLAWHLSISRTSSITTIIQSSGSMWG